MRIAQLQLQNFGSLRKANFDFETPISLIYGRNNAGKSTVADAIEYVLTGRTRGTDARGAGIDGAIFDGADSMKAGLMLAQAERQAVIVRAVKGKSSSVIIDGESGQLAIQQKAICDLAGASVEVLQALCSTRAFLALGHAEAKDLILRVLNVRVPYKDAQLTIAQLDTAYEQAFEARRQAKAELAAVRIPAPPLSDERPEVSDLEAQLAALRTDLEGLVSSSAKDSGNRASLERQLQAFDNDLGLIAKQLEAAPDWTPEIEELEQKLAELAPPVAAVRKEKSEAHQDAKTRLRTLVLNLEDISQHSPARGCIIDAAIPCKTPGKQFEQAAKRLEDEKAELARTVEELEKTITEFASFDDAKAAAEKQLADLKARQSTRAKLLEHQGIARKTRDRIFDDIAALPPVSEEPENVKALRERIAAGERTIAEARRLAADWKAHEEAKERQERAAEKVAALEKKCELLGPKGLRVQALEAAIGTFEAGINGALSRFGYALTFRLDPWDVLVNGRSSARLSESERMRVGLSLQMALADVTGVGFVVIDGVDLLLPGNRAVLVELLESWEGQAIVTCAREDEPPAMDGITVYWLTLGADGATQVQRVGEAVTA